MKIELANLEDIQGVLSLQNKYQINTIDEADKKDGFVTTRFTSEQLASLIKNEKGLFVAKENEVVVAYAMAASWSYWSAWPFFAHMIKSLNTLRFGEYSLSIENSYQYGPICIDKAFRNSGLFEALFDFSLAQTSATYPVLVTFINKVNTRSFAAHTQKVGLAVIHEFEYDGNFYYELACLTHKLG